MNELDLALDKVTIKLLEGLKEGETIELSENFEIYRYTEDDCIVVIDKSEDEEIYCVQYNKKLKQIIFEGL